MSQLFISYSRTDEAFARQLATDLARDGLDVWIDVDDIPSGANWSNAINDGLNKADVLLLIMSPDSLVSKNVEDEWQFFHAKRKPIIPVQRADGGNIHFQLARIQYVDFHARDYEVAYDELLVELRRHGFEIERLTETLARLEAQRTAADAERDRLRREIVALQNTQAETERLQQELVALKEAEAQQSRLDQEIDQLHQEEKVYQKVKASESKRSTSEAQRVGAQSQVQISKTLTVDRPPKPTPILDPIRPSLWKSPKGIIGIVGVVAILALGGYMIASSLFLGNDDDDPEPTQSTQSDNSGPSSDTQFALDIVADYRNHDSTITDVAYSPHGDRLAVASIDWRVSIVEVETEEVSQFLSDMDYHVAGVAWSPDNNYLAVIEYADLSPGDERIWGNLMVYDVGNWELIGLTDLVTFPCEMQSGPVWHPEHNILAASCDNMIYIWSNEGEASRIVSYEHAGAIVAMDWSSWEQLAVLDEDHEVVFYLINEDGNNLDPVDYIGDVLKDKTLYKLQISEDGSKVAVAGGDLEKWTGTVEVYDLDDQNKRIYTLDGENLEDGPVVDLVWNGTWLATLSSDGWVELWDEGDYATDIEIPDVESVTSIDWLPTIEQIVVGTDNADIFFLSVSSE